MVAVTYGVARAAARAANSAGARAFAAAAKAKSKAFFVRLYNAIVEAQMRRAAREIALYRPLIDANIGKRDTR